MSWVLQLSMLHEEKIMVDVNKNFTEFDTVTSLARTDLVLIWDIVAAANKGITFSDFCSNLFSISASNTSNTKSYQIVPTLTQDGAGSEAAKIEFKGLWQGNEKTFMDFTGASNDFNTYAQNWIHTNATATISVLEHKVNLNTEGGDGFYFNRVTAKNGAGTPVDTVYYRDRTIIGANTAGSEDGIHALDVMENGSLIEYLQLNGLTGYTNLR